MDNLVKNIKHNIWLRAAIFVIIGLLVAFKPGLLIDWSIKILAIYLVVVGIISLVNGFKQPRVNGGLNATMTVGILELVGALLVWLFAKPLLAILPFVLGIGLLIHGINYAMQIRSQRQYVNVKPWPSYLYAILVIVAAVILIINPFGSLTLMFRVFGWLLVIMGITEFIGTTHFFKD